MTSRSNPEPERMGFEPDDFLCVWSCSPSRAAAFFGYVLGETARVEVQDKSDKHGRVLYHVYPLDGGR